MEPENVSGTVTISDQRLYIKTENLRGKNFTEFHGTLNEVYGVFTVDRSTVLVGLIVVVVCAHR